MPMDMPDRNDWQQLKKKHKVPDGAVKGVNLGAAIDKVTKAKNTAARIAAVADLEKVAAGYLAKVDKKSITNYAQFEKSFLDAIVEPAHAEAKRVKLVADGAALYKSELQKFFQAVQKLDADKSKPGDMQVFTRFARGLFSASLRVKDVVDATAINKQLNIIYKADDKMNWTKATQEDVGKFVDKVLVVANQIRKLAKAQGLV